MSGEYIKAGVNGDFFGLAPNGNAEVVYKTAFYIIVFQKTYRKRIVLKFVLAVCFEKQFFSAENVHGINLIDERFFAEETDDRLVAVGRNGEAV